VAPVDPAGAFLLKDYEQGKIRRLGPDAVEPKRIRYNKFKR